MKKLNIIVLVLTLQLVTVNAETYKLDLQKSIEIAKEKSYSMQNLAKELRIAEYNLKAATSRQKTHIDLNLVAPNFLSTVDEFRTDTSLTYYTRKEIRYGGNLSISQPLPTAGNITLESGLFNKDSYSLGNRSPNIYTTFSLDQPLTSLYGYNAVKSNLKKAKLAFEYSKKGLKREELNLIYQVSNAFYNLLSDQKGTEIARLNLERQTEAYEISQNKYKAGLIKEVDALQMEVDLAEAQNNHDLAIVNFNNSQNEFKQLIGINLNDSVIINNEFKYQIVIVDPEKAVKLALENRLEVREQEINIEQNKLNLKEQKSNGMIQSSVKLSYGMAGYSKQNINYSLTGSIQNSFDNYIKRDPDYGIGLTVKVPILDFGENRAKVNAAKLNLEQNLLRKEDVQRGIEREVRNLVAGLNSNLKRLQLLEKNIAIAEKSFEITRQRYADGDIDSQSLALERNRLNTAYTSHLRAYTSYQLMLADLMRKTFYDFQKDELLK